jgi:probable HAF family extracellular repeat protein
LLALVLSADARAGGPSIVPLDAVPGTIADVTARAIAADGTVVGGNSLGGQATVWTPGPTGYTAQLLPLTAGLDDAFANFVNAGGTIAGYQVDVDGNPTATLWQRTGGAYSAKPLPTPAGMVGASAFAINTGGQVAGLAVTATGDTRAVLWQPAPARGAYTANLMLNPPGTTGQRAATAINDLGDVAGYAAVPSPPFAPGPTIIPIVWESDGVGRQVFVVQSGVAAALNNNGVGAGVDTSGSTALPMVIAEFEGDYFGAALSMPNEHGSGAANHLNDSDVIVGNAIDMTSDVAGRQAALWIPTDIYWDYLNLDDWFRQQQDPADTGQWILREANFITAGNLIVGDAEFDPDGDGPLPAYSRGFVLDASAAVPEPAIAPVLFVVGLSLCRRGRHRTKSCRTARAG